MRGVKLPFNSIEESLAVSAISRRQSIHFITTLSIVNAIIQIGNVIAAAVSGSSAPNRDNLEKTISGLKDLLFPDEKDIREEKASKALKLLQKEINAGPLIATPKVSSKKMKGRIIRGGSVNGSPIS